MQEPKRPLKVFLCHAHADRDAVRALYTRLTNDAVDAWLDKEKLLPGQDWELEIKKAVREADVVVVCLSKQFNQAGFRQKEVRLALDTAMEKPEGEIFIIPARLEECENLESLRKWHWVDLYEDGGYEMLTRALRARANKIGATLQIKKGFLPKASSSRQPQQKLTSTFQTASHERNDKSKIEGGKPKQKATVRKLFSKTVLAFWSIFILVGIVLAFWIPSLRKPFSETPTLQNTPVAQFTEILPTATTTIVVTTPTSLPTEITDAKGVSMLLVPEGEFVRGSKGAETTEYLEGFYIDKYEVTNSLYSLCVSDGGCKLPADNQLGDYVYYGNSQYDNFPVVWVNSDMAQTYCNWRTARLPLVSEWEKAARGVSGFLYPWGNELDEVIRENSYTTGDGYSITSPVGSFPEGVSPFGVHDMAGNVSEWVTGGIAMGNSWRYGDTFMFDSNDYPQISNSSSPDLGIRCAKDVP